MTLIKPPLPQWKRSSVEEIPTATVGNTNQNGTVFAASRFAERRNLSAIEIWPAARALFPGHRCRVIAPARKKFVLDGELVIDVGGRFSFDELQLGFIPPPVGSRNWRQPILPHLSFLIYWKATLANRFSRFRSANVGLRWRNSRRKILNQLAAIKLAPATTSLAQAKKWFDKAGGNLDGIIGKRLDAALCLG